MNETIILGLTAALVVLGYVAYQITRFKNLFPKKTKKDILAEQERLATRKSLGKYINADGTPYRTTTFGQIVLQALKSNDFVKKVKIDMLTGKEFIGEIPIKDILKEGGIVEESRDHPIEEIDRTEICKSEVTYERFIEEYLELQLSDLCPCPCDSSKYCDWSGRMIQKFIVDTSTFNVISIQVVDPVSNKILATSALNDIEKIGNYLIICMKELCDLTELPPGKAIRVELQWMPIGSDKIQSIDFCNKIPVLDDTIETVPVSLTEIIK